MAKDFYSSNELTLNEKHILYSKITKTNENRNRPLFGRRINFNLSKFCCRIRLIYKEKDI